MKRQTLKPIIALLRKRHGAPVPAVAVGPWQHILWENVAYLADDEARAAAFGELRKSTAFDPARIIDADDTVLLAATSHGIMAGSRVEKLRVCAQIALDEFKGDVDSVLKLPPKKAMAALRKFPGIGVPGAEKILMIEHAMPMLALDSNGLRVLLRLGFGAQQKDYSASYRSVREALGGEVPSGFDALIEAHHLLRIHGRRICTNSSPDCASCPLAKTCPSAT